MITATKSALKDILYLRELFLQENNFQIRYDAMHRRGWTDSYLIKDGDDQIGYGSVAGHNKIEDRDIIFEFYIIPPFRQHASKAFQQLLLASSVPLIEAQTNDLLLSAMLNQFTDNAKPVTVLLGEEFTSDLKLPGATFRKRVETDQLFQHKDEPEGDYVVEMNGEIVASGGFLLHYNMPFADLYMEVKPEHRRKGVGSFLIQEVKKQCYLSGRVPAARTGMDNIGSKLTLMKAGLSKVDHILMGNVRSKK